MQICGNLSPQYVHSQHQFPKIASTPTLQTFGCPQIQTTDYTAMIQDGYWRAATKTILKLKKCIKISKDSLFLAITYLRRIVIDFRFQINENNY